MVQIVDYKTYHKADGEQFFALVVQGGLEAIKSKETGRMYFTARTARVACTFNEVTCKSLISTKLPGSIKRVATDPYEFTIQETGEVIELSHRYEYISEEESIIENNVTKTQEVY